MDGVAIADRVGQPLQRDKGSALGRQQAIGIFMKWANLARRADGFQCTEADVEKQIVTPAYCAGQHKIGAARLQFLASQLDGIERRSARGIQRKGPAIELERARASRCAARPELKRATGSSGGPNQKDSAKLANFSVGTQKTEDGAGARGCSIQGAQSGVEQRLARGVEHPAYLLIVRYLFSRIDRETVRVELIGKIGNVTAPIRTGAARLVTFLSEDRFFRSAPAIFRAA